MHIVPVIDLKGGEVVRARQGIRHLYAPIVTPLSATSRPLDVVGGFLALHPFPSIYIADLDAIEGRGDHADTVAALEAAYPSVTFWLDAGVADRAGAQKLLERHRCDVVLGSETLRDREALAQLRRNPRILLSLDFRAGAYEGPEGLAEAEALWPDRIIVMSLALVGSGQGPDLMALEKFVSRAEGRHAVYAAGGLRGAADLFALAGAGVRGVLVASALHDGKLDQATLAGFHQG